MRTISVAQRSTRALAPVLIGDSVISSCGSGGNLVAWRGSLCGGSDWFRAHGMDDLGFSSPRARPQQPRAKRAGMTGSAMREDVARGEERKATKGGPYICLRWLMCTGGWWPAFGVHILAPRWGGGLPHGLADGSKTAHHAISFFLLFLSCLPSLIQIFCFYFQFKFQIGFRVQLQNAQLKISAWNAHFLHLYNC